MTDDALGPEPGTATGEAMLAGDDAADLIERLGPDAHGYVAGGVGDEWVLAENRRSWGRWLLQPRVLVDVSERDTAVTLLGVDRSHPFVVAPMGYQRHAHPDGETALVAAAAATGTPYVISASSTTSLPEIAAAAPGATRWFQLYVYRDRQISLDLAAQARETGCEVLVITVDLPVVRHRARERTRGLRLDHPVVSDPRAGAADQGELYAEHDPSLTWDDLAQFVDAAGLPFVLKGILRPGDARRAAELGASGIVVSNHGGRQLDAVPTGADALVPIVDLVGDTVDVLVDGGIRRGWDAAKALALGADGVLVGRGVLWGLAREGEAGARAVLERLVTELDSTLALVGCPRARDLDPSYVLPAPR